MLDANSTKVGVALFVSYIFCVTVRTIMKSIYVLLCAIGLELWTTGSLHIKNTLRPSKREVICFCILRILCNLRKIASIIVGINEDNDATFLKRHVPHALAATVIGKRADVEQVT